jgi:chromate reductase, NAD(P)H dehydrogenase (quinone)
MAKKVGILVGTNRSGSMSLEMAGYFRNKLSSKGIESVLIDLEELPDDFAFSALYHNKGKNEVYNDFQMILDSVDKLFLIAPEYNGSFPGVLKAFIDGLRYPDSFTDKKIGLVGLSDGVLGNAVGLSHLNDILSYMGANVLGLRLKLGEIAKHFDGNTLSNKTYEKFIDQQIENLLAF